MDRRILESDFLKRFVEGSWLADGASNESLAVKEALLRLLDRYPGFEAESWEAASGCELGTSTKEAEAFWLADGAGLSRDIEVESVVCVGLSWVVDRSSR